MHLETVTMTITVTARLRVADGTDGKLLFEEIVSDALRHVLNNRTNLHREDEGMVSFGFDVT